MDTAGETFFTPQGLAFLGIAAVLLLILPRKYAVVPIIAMTCYMPMSQRIMIAGLNFTMIRLLVAAAWLRVLLRGEYRGLKLNAIDWAMIWWMISAVILHTLLWQTGREFINRLGIAYEAIGAYFFFRWVVRDVDEIIAVAKQIAVFIVPLAAAMFFEKMTQRNLFAFLGVVHPITQIREGVLRCQGPFSHPILAGTFGAVQVPLMVVLWDRRYRARFLAIVGLIAALVITITSGSSGPVMTLLCAVFALGLWHWRFQMRRIRWAGVGCLAFLQLFMHRPFYFIMADVDLFAGSTGYHRAILIDMAVRHLGQWWLVGIKSTAGWTNHLVDVTNAFLWEGVNGGLLSMLLFILVIVRCFRAVGQSLRRTTRASGEQFLMWALGAVLFSHVISFLGVQYFDQTIFAYYLCLALIASGSDAITARALQQEEAAVPERAAEPAEEEAVPESYAF
jgi:hypothetical protein